MKALHEIASRIQLHLEAGMPSDDSWMPNIDAIKDKVLVHRANMISKVAMKLPIIPDQYYYKKCCIELKCREIACGDVKSGKQEWYFDVPSLIGLAGKRAVKFVGSEDYTISMEWRTSPKDIHENSGLYGTTTTPYFIIRNGEAIVYKKPNGLKLLCYELLVDNPEISCDENDDFPMPADHLKEIENDIVREMLTLRPKTHDFKNNSSPNPQ